MVFGIEKCKILSIATGKIFISNGRYIDYLSLTYATNESRILKVAL